jgi:hypothetical protein
MRKILGFGIVLAVASLTGTARIAYGQPGTGAVRTYPGNTTTGIGNAVTGYQGVAPYPGAVNRTTYSSNDSAPGYQAGTYPGPSTGATPGYTSRVMPGMAGYNDINPMATTMAPGYYYAGTGGMPYATYNTPGYSSMYGSGYPYPGSASGYGYGVPYDATAYAAPGAGVTYSPAYVAPAGSAANTVMPAPGRSLGIAEEPITDAIGQRGMKVTSVYPGSAAEQAGLRVGDVIYASNGYLTEKRGDLAWIIANAAPDSRLNMSVKTARDRREHFLTAQLPRFR